MTNVRLWDRPCTVNILPATESDTALLLEVELIVPNSLYQQFSNRESPDLWIVTKGEHRQQLVFESQDDSLKVTYTARIAVPLGQSFSLMGKHTTYATWHVTEEGDITNSYSAH